MKWLIGVGLLVWLIHSNGGFDDATPAATVPWELATTSTYEASCVADTENRRMGERLVPGLDEVDQMGDSTTYGVLLKDSTVVMVECSSPPPEHLR